LYTGQFNQHICIVIKDDNHDECLQVAKTIKKQCEAWDFCVRYDQYKSARKGDVLKRELMVYQNAGAGDIVIFKEALRRVCQQYQNIQFTDRGAEPENSLRNTAL
jgi:hypothetical protein